MSNAAKYMIIDNNEVAGVVKFARTEKGDRWLLCLYDKAGNDTVLRYRDFDTAYTAAYKKKPTGSMVINAEDWKPQ